MLVLAVLSAGDYAILVPIIIASIAQAVVTVIVALRQSQVKAAVEAVHHEITPPSNGQTAGEMLEGVATAAGAAAIEASRVRKALEKQNNG